MTNNLCSNKQPSGNVLFLILIAVALFAALSYVIVNSSRSGSGQANLENARLIKSQMENTISAISTAITRKKLNDRCSNQEIKDNFCPPSTLGCAWITKPLCNVVSSTDPAAPKLNWVATKPNFFLRFSIRNKNASEALVWMDGGSDISTQYSLIYIGIYMDVWFSTLTLRIWRPYA